MRRIARTLPLLTCLLVLSCVTINIYFPAEEVRDAADRIVNEVWGEGETAPATTPDSPQSFWRWLQVNEAVAAQDINVSTPEIRAIKDSMKNRSSQLFPYLDSGHVGIGANGLLKVRTTDGLALKDRGKATKLVKEENSDRQRLYREIAIANGFSDKAGEVQTIFADSWRQQARSGWYIETSGGWKKK